MGEVPPNRHDPEQVLVFDEVEFDRRETCAVLAQQFPFAKLISTSTLDETRRATAAQDFDLVVLPDSALGGNPLRLIQELKLKEQEPGVLVLTRNYHPKAVADIYAAGAHRCVVRGEGWNSEVAPAVRHLLRHRRLEEENRALLAKLTEANLLLEERNKRLNEFSATLAHDIRGPLGGIAMKLEYMLDLYEKNLDKRCAELLKRALKASERLTGVVQGMYEFARLGAKATKMDMLPLGTLVEEVIGDLNVGAAIDVHIAIGELPSIFGNDTLLRRVFINLITNAIKYNSKSTREVHIYQRGIFKRSIGAFAEIIVEDNGRGIPQEEVRDLFTMFSRGSSSEGDTEGSGIGLAVVQRIVELHFGSVSVESEVGKGTKFVITLPMESIDLSDHEATVAQLG